MLPRVHFHEQLVYGYVRGMLRLRERERERGLLLPTVHFCEQLGLANLSLVMSEAC